MMYRYATRFSPNASDAVVLVCYDCWHVMVITGPGDRDCLGQEAQAHFTCSQPA